MTVPVNWGQELAPLTLVHQPPAEVPGAQLPDQTQLFTWAEKIIEGVVRRVVLAIVGTVFPNKSAVGQLADWATKLENQLGDLPGFDDFLTFLNGQLLGTSPDTGFPYDFPVDLQPILPGPLFDFFAALRRFLPANLLDEDFDPEEAAREFIENTLNPANLLARLSSGGKLLDGQAPQVFLDLLSGLSDGLGGGSDGSASELVARVSEAFDRLRQFFAFDFTSDTFDVDDAAAAFITNVLKPQGLLATLVGGKLPDAQAPAAINDIVQSVTNALKGLAPQTGSGQGNWAQAIWNAFTSLVSQLSGTAGQIAVINSNQNAGDNGVIYSTEFDGAQNAVAFPNIVYDGSGTGTWVLWGDGTTRWTNLSSATRRGIGMAPTTATTKYVTSKMTLTSPIDDVTPSPSRFHLVVRMNAARTEYAMCTVTRQQRSTDGQWQSIGWVEVVKAGVVTQLGATFVVPDTGAGQQWEFRGGSKTNDYDYTLTLSPNGGLLATRTDSDHVVSIANRNHGGGETTGANIYGGTLPAHLTSYAGGDFVP